MEIQDEAEKWAFETFADCYPHEAYDFNPIKFCDYVRSKGRDITNEQIIELLKEDV